MWIQLLLSELNVLRRNPTPILAPQSHQQLTKPTVIRADNQGAIALAKNPEYHARTKHIAICYHFIRQEVDKDIVRFDYIETSTQAADGFTKPLSKIAFARFISQLNLM